MTEALEKATLGPSARLATKGDVAAVRAKLASFRTELKAESAAVRAGLHKEIGGPAWKAAGLLLAQAAFIIAFIKLLP